MDLFDFWKRQIREAYVNDWWNELGEEFCTCWCQVQLQLQLQKSTPLLSFLDQPWRF